MFNRKWSEEIAASFSFISSTVPTFKKKTVRNAMRSFGSRKAPGPDGFKPSK